MVPIGRGDTSQAAEAEKPGPIGNFTQLYVLGYAT